MLTKTLAVLKESEKLLYFASKLFKLYIGEGHLTNMAVICEILGDFFSQRNEYMYSQLFFMTALQYAIVLDDIDVS